MLTTREANVMILLNDFSYKSGSGFSAQIEDGFTPNGTPIGGRWVLRDKTGEWVDVDQYRHDLFERNGLRTVY